jgi:hypothetical protein
MDGIGHDATAVSGAIGKCPLRRKEDAIPAIVAMTKRALDFVNFGFSRLQRPIELTAMFAKQILPVKGHRRLGKSRTKRLGAYLLHSADFLNLRRERSADRCQSEKD